MEAERVVFDTNVLISGLLSGTSTPARALEAAIRNDELVATADTLRELMTKLLSPKLMVTSARERRDALLLRLAPLVEIVAVAEPVCASRGRKDDKFLEAAVNGRAAVVVTGDRDLLDLHPFRGIAILSPAPTICSERDQSGPASGGRERCRTFTRSFPARTSSRRRKGRTCREARFRSAADRHPTGRDDGSCDS